MYGIAVVVIDHIIYLKIKPMLEKREWNKEATKFLNRVWIGNATVMWSRQLFLTGEAWTWKSTLIADVVRHYNGDWVVILCPTWVSSGAVQEKLWTDRWRCFVGTIHSFFGLRPWNHELDHESIVKKLRSVRLLIIDEISMVRRDLFDLIYQYISWLDRLVFVWDFGQLPPVVTKWEMEMFPRNDYRASDSNNWVAEKITLVTKYRQKEWMFADVLDKIRVWWHKQSDIDYLNKKVITREIYDSMTIKPLFICSRNIDAVEANNKMLSLVRWLWLTSECKVYINKDNEKIARKFFANKNNRNTMYEEVLNIKVGCQVMITKNDKVKWYYNWNIWRVNSISANWVEIELENSTTVTVKPELTEMYEKRYNKAYHKIEDIYVGDIIQYPIKLWYAITVHKSQGLTLNSILVDPGEAWMFACWQLYVALSRVTSYEWLWLKRPIKTTDVLVENRVLSLMK